MTTYSWKNAVSGHWSDASAWLGVGAPPNAPTADAAIDVAGAYSVTLDVGQTFALDALNVAATGATLDVGGTLTLDGSRLVTGLWRTLLLRGTLRDAILAPAGGRLVGAGGTLDAAKVRGILALAARGDALTIGDGVVLTGASGVGPGAVYISPGATLTVAGTTTLDNATITLATFKQYASVPDGGLVGAGNDSVLTLGPHLVVQDAAAGRDAGAYLSDGGHKGDILVNTGAILADTSSGTFEIGGNSFVNTGLISVGNGDTLIINATSFQNTGTISAIGGYLTISNLTGNLGTISAVGGSEDNGGLFLSGNFIKPGSIGSITGDSINFGLDGKISTQNFDSLKLSNIYDGLQLDGVIVNTGATLDVTGAGNFDTYQFYGTIQGGSWMATAPSSPPARWMVSRIGARCSSPRSIFQ